MFTDVRLPGQLVVSDQMLIVSTLPVFRILLLAAVLVTCFNKYLFEVFYANGS